MLGNKGYRKDWVIFSLAMAGFSVGCQFHQSGDTLELRANCKQEIAKHYQVSESTIYLTFGRVDEGATAYGFKLKKGESERGFCRAKHNGGVEPLFFTKE